MTVKIIVEIVGWIGAVLILAAYALNSSGKMKASDRAYQMMNVIGAAAFIVNSGYNQAFPSAALNVIWMGIGIFALIRMRTRASGS